MSDLKTVLDSANVPQAVKASAWDAYQNSSSPQDFQAKFDVLPLDKATKANLWDLKFSQSRQTLNPNQPGMQPAVNGLAPRDVSDKAAETLDSLWQGIHNGAHAIPQMLDALHEGTPSHEIEKRGIIKGSIELIKKGFEQLNPVAPDRGQGPLNRTAETVGNVAGAAATPTPEDVAGIAKTGMEGVKKIPVVIKNAVPTVASFASKIPADAIGLLSPRAAHGMRILGKLDSILQQSAAAAPIAEKPPVADTSVPASSLSMTQFPPKFAAPAENLAEAAHQKVQAIIDNAAAKTQEVIAKAKKLNPGTYADRLDDRAFAQEFNWDLEQQGHRALSEERQKYFADNGPQLTKGQLIVQSRIEKIMDDATTEARKVLEAAKIPSEVPKAKIAAKITATRSTIAQPEDLTDLLRRSIEAAQRAKANKGVKGN